MRIDAAHPRPPGEIQWQTRRFPASSQPNLHFHSVRLRKRKKDELLTITGTSFHWSEDSEKQCSDVPRLFAKQLVTSEETRSSVPAPSFSCSMNRSSRSDEDWVALSPISFAHHFEREEEIDTVLPTDSVHCILHRGHKEQRRSDASNQRHSSDSIHRDSQRNRRRTLSKLFSPLKRSNRTFHCPSASVFDRLAEEPLARRWTEWMNWIHCSWESVGRNSLSPHCSSSFDSKWRSILRTFVEVIDRLDLFISHMIKGKGKETRAISTEGQRIQVKRPRRRNIWERECDDLFSPLCSCERTNEWRSLCQQSREKRPSYRWVNSLIILCEAERKTSHNLSWASDFHGASFLHWRQWKSHRWRNKSSIASFPFALALALWLYFSNSWNIDLVMKKMWIWVFSRRVWSYLKGEREVSSPVSELSFFFLQKKKIILCVVINAWFQNFGNDQREKWICWWTHDRSFRSSFLESRGTWVNARKTIESLFHRQEKNSLHFYAFDEHYRDETLVSVHIFKNFGFYLRMQTELKRRGDTKLNISGIVSMTEQTRFDILNEDR